LLNKPTLSELTKLVYNENNDIFYFHYIPEKEILVIPIPFEQKLAFLINTFEKDKVLSFISSFKNIISLDISRVHFKNQSFKNIVSSNCSVVEISAIVNDSMLEEISISGSDIKNSEFYKMILDNGEINKIVLYLDVDHFNCVVKVFVDGKISIIPELNSNQTKLVFSHLLKRLEIE